MAPRTPSTSAAAMITAAGPRCVMRARCSQNFLSASWRRSTRLLNPPDIGTNETRTGSRMRSVRMMTPMPRLAVTAISDHLHRDQEDRDEPDEVREERDDRRQEQQPEGPTRRLVAVR